MEKRDILANIDPDLLRGEGVVDFNIMFSGKTFRIRQQVDAIDDMNKHRSQKRQIGYVVINNAVDTSVVSGATYSRRTGSIPALTIPRHHPEKAIEELHRLDETEGFKHVILWDELQFLDLRVIPVILELQRQERVQWLAGLKSDFRGEDYFHMEKIAKLFSYRVVSRATCTFETEQGEQCSEPAVQTVRMVKPSDEQTIVYPDRTSRSFYKKENGKSEVLVADHVYAPYWQVTSLPRGTQGIEYTVACVEHTFVPRLTETRALFSYIRNQRETDKKHLDAHPVFSEYPDLDSMLEFIVNERGIKYDSASRRYSSKGP